PSFSARGRPPRPFHCCAPSIRARMGALFGLRASDFPGAQSKSRHSIKNPVEFSGRNYQNVTVPVFAVDAERMRRKLYTEMIERARKNFSVRIRCLLDRDTKQLAIFCIDLR